MGLSALAELGLGSLPPSDAGCPAPRVPGRVPGQGSLPALLCSKVLSWRRSGPCLTYLLTSGCLEGRQICSAKEVAFCWEAKVGGGSRGGKCPQSGGLSVLGFCRLPGQCWNEHSSPGSLLQCYRLGLNAHWSFPELEQQPVGIAVPTAETPEPCSSVPCAAPCSALFCFPRPLPAPLSCFLSPKLVVKRPGDTCNTGRTSQGCGTWAEILVGQGVTLLGARRLVLHFAFPL